MAPREENGRTSAFTGAEINRQSYPAKSNFRELLKVKVLINQI